MNPPQLLSGARLRLLDDQEPRLIVPDPAGAKPFLGPRFAKILDQFTGEGNLGNRDSITETRKMRDDLGIRQLGFAYFGFDALCYASRVGNQCFSGTVLVRFQPSLRDSRVSKIAHPTLERWAIIKNPFGMRILM